MPTVQDYIRERDVIQRIERIHLTITGTEILVEISLPPDTFHNVAREMRLELRPDRASYGGQMPCAWFHGIKIMPMMGSSREG